MRDILFPKQMCSTSESPGLFKFWEISDNILLTVQYRDILQWKTKRQIGNRTWPIKWHHCLCPWM